MPDPIVTVVNELQRTNAWFPIVVTESGIIIDVKPVSANAPTLIDVTEMGIVIDNSAAQYWNVFVPIDVMLDPIVTVVNELQLMNAFVPIDVMLDPIVTVVKFDIFLHASSGIVPE